MSVSQPKTSTTYVAALSLSDLRHSVTLLNFGRCKNRVPVSALTFYLLRLNAVAYNGFLAFPLVSLTVRRNRNCRLPIGTNNNKLGEQSIDLDWLKSCFGIFRKRSLGTAPVQLWHYNLGACGTFHFQNVLWAGDIVRLCLVNTLNVCQIPFSVWLNVPNQHDLQFLSRFIEIQNSEQRRNIGKLRLQKFIFI